jgi:hypothetical protein
VDGVHKRVFVSDPTNGKIVVTDYAGTVVQQVTNLPGVSGLELSADSTTLYAAVTDTDEIVALGVAAAGTTESARYPVGDAPLSVAWAGGRLWFGYGASAAGCIGSVDLSGEQPVVTLDQDKGWYSAPLLDAAPGSDILVAGQKGSSPATVASYDVATGSAAKLATTTQAGSDLGDLQVTPDGQNVITASGWPYQHSVFRTADLTANGTYASAPYPNSVAVAPNGTVAAGVMGIYDPDIFVYEPGSTTSVREYDFPNTGNDSGGDLLPDSGLAWAPDASRLFAIVQSDDGRYTLRVLTTPTKAATTMSVSAPATAPRAKTLTVTGKVTSRVALPAGAQVTVTRTDLEHPNGQALKPAALKADGTYAFTDTPYSGGKVRYTVRYAGDAEHTGSVSSDTVEVSRATPALTLNNNGRLYSYGADVRFTAHLGSTYKNRAVEIWADPFGTDRPKRLIKSGTVNSSGNISGVVDMARDTTVYAVFKGDSRYKPRTVKVTAYAKVRVSTAVSRHYRTGKIGSTTYYWFHKSTNPLLTTAMTYYPGRMQRFDLQAYYDGSWHTLAQEYFTLGTDGKSAVDLGAPGEAGVKARMRSVYVNGSSGDSVNSTTYGSWKYLYFSN